MKHYKTDFVEVHHLQIPVEPVLDNYPTQQQQRQFKFRALFGEILETLQGVSHHMAKSY